LRPRQLMRQSPKSGAVGIEVGVILDDARTNLLLALDSESSVAPCESDDDPADLGFRWDESSGVQRHLGANKKLREQVEASSRHSRNI
jgi:hypothetical protein